jgi:hypothetical protein
MDSIKTVKYSNEPVFVHSDGTLEPYIPIKITSNREAYCASIDMLFKHVTEFHILLVDIIAEKTGLNSDEIIAQIQKDKRLKEMIHIPTVYANDTVTEKDVEKVIPITPSIDFLTQKMEGMGVTEGVSKKRKYVKKVKT